jgi:hypothetical protein
MDDGIDREVEKLRAEWEGNGYYPAVVEAFQWCVLNDRLLPNWVADAAYGALILAANKGGRKGRGKTGSYLYQARRAEIDQRRWGVADHALAFRSDLPSFGAYEANRQGAFAHASDLLAGTPAQGSPEAIERSYNRIQKQKRRA